MRRSPRFATIHGVYKLASFGFNELMEWRSALRTMFDDPPPTLHEAGERIVGYFREVLVDDDGRPACALVRLFKTHRYDALDPELQDYARRMLPDADAVADLRCLVLLATAGDEPAWNEPRASRGHRAIPLASESMVSEAPMIAQLITQLGLSISTVLRPGPALLLDLQDKSSNVFYVPHAAGSPYIVAQKEFVERYGIESVLGVGGILATGDLFAAILFSRVPITPETADFFKVVSLNLKMAILPLSRLPLF
jgi:hypothetical protein